MVACQCEACKYGYFTVSSMVLTLLVTKTATFVVMHSACLQVSPHHGMPSGGQFMRTSSVELGDIYRTASAISVFLEEADARPFINRLMSMPAMSADGIASRQLFDASTINPNVEVSPRGP